MESPRICLVDRYQYLFGFKLRWWLQAAPAPQHCIDLGNLTKAVKCQILGPQIVAQFLNFRQLAPGKIARLRKHWYNYRYLLKNFGSGNGTRYRYRYLLFLNG